MTNKIKIQAILEVSLLITSIFAFSFIIGVGNIKPVSAEEVEEAIGCCFDTEEGLCDPNSLKSLCEEKANGKFLNDVFCNVNECRIGCCIVGLDVIPGITQRRCEKLSELYATPSKWDSLIQDASQCFISSRSQEVGACVVANDYEEKNQCKFSTREECDQLEGGGVFYPGYLCSNEELNTICEKQADKECIDDKVYWVDSCGNKENVYSSSKTQSYNGGKVLSVSESCNPNNANIDSNSCGNCNYELGSICSDEELKCIDLNCEDAPLIVNLKGEVKKTKDRINGESWCVYDGQVGNFDLGIGKLFGINIPLGWLSTDIVGSRHWKYSCINGKVQVDGCRDERREICVQSKETLENGKEIDNAVCRVNLWEQCIGYNGGLGSLGSVGSGQGGCGAGCIAQCINNPDCRIHYINIGKSFNFATCVPNYPPGFDVGTNFGEVGQNLVNSYSGEFGEVIGDVTGLLNKGANGNDVCSLGTQTCTVVFIKGCPGGWKCIENCDCLSLKFTAQMNNLCTSLGDCGFYTNIAGKTPLKNQLTTKITKKGTKGKPVIQPWVLAPFYFIFANPSRGQVAHSAIFDEVPEILELASHGLIDPFMGGYSSTNPNLEGIGEFMDTGISNNIVASALTAGVTGIASVTGSAAINTVIIDVAGLIPAEGVTLNVMGNVGTSTVYSVSAPATTPGFFARLNPLNWSPWTLAAMAAMYALMEVLDCDAIEEVEVTFTCSEWVPPAGGDDCHLCNEDEMRGCTEYRCKSLGTKCYLLNKGTAYDECVSLEGEDNIPIISPWEEVLNTSLYQYTEASNNGFRVRQKDGDCIKAFTPLLFGVETDVYSSCRISTDKTFGEVDVDGNSLNPYSGGYDLFFENIAGIYTKNHTYATNLPSIQSIIYNEIGEDTGEDKWQEAYDELHEYLLDETGNMNFYVKCMNLEGEENEQDYMINFCVRPGPDVDVPIIGAVSPGENSLVKFDATAQNMRLWVTEPAECRWGVIKPTAGSLLEQYNGLSNQMTCQTNPGLSEFVNLGQYSFFGYECNDTLPITDVENKFYFMCRDQPWLEENISRHISEAYEYILKKSESALEIDSIFPEDNSKIRKGAEPVTIDLQVKTSGGAEEGISRCEYNLDNSINVPFLEINVKNHFQPGLQLLGGEHNIKISCVDNVGNTAEAETTFTLELDTDYPIITRVYHESGNLVAITNEEATCKYTNDEEVGCSFNFESKNTILMEGSLTKYQTIDWDSELIYYIKCKDLWGKHPSECSIIIKPEDLI